MVLFIIEVLSKKDNNFNWRNIIMAKTAILLGTSRVDGNTSSMIKAIEDKKNVKTFMLSDYSISPFDYKHKNIEDDFLKLVKKLLSYDHIIFASPVYWYAMSAQMKVFFDRISDLLHVKKELGRKLRSKSCAVISTGASSEPMRSFEEVFINSFDYLGMKYKGMLYCYCEDDFKLVEHDEYINSQLEKIL